MIENQTHQESNYWEECIITPLPSGSYSYFYRLNLEHPKPDPEPVIKALTALDHRFGQVAYFVGDTDVDMLAAS